MNSNRLKASLNWTKAPTRRLLALLGLGWSRKIGGHRFFFDPSTEIGLELLVTGQFEKDAVAQCAKFVRPDGIVVDVGANIGVHAVHFADMAPSGRVICFEPARSTFAYLLRNVQHLTNVIPLNLALSDSAGVQTFYVAADSAFSGLKDTQRKAILRQESIACFRGDEILRALIADDQRVDLIKIDVEGFEMQVLEGMREFIVVHRPVIFCEIFGGQHSNPDPESTVRFCTSLGYDAFVMRDGQLMPADTHDDTLYNYFFVPRHR
jgi:FkbM family methyltransferase